MQVHYIVAKQPMNTKTIIKGKWSTIRVDESGDHTTICKNVEEGSAYFNAQCDATDHGLEGTYIRRLED